MFRLRTTLRPAGRRRAALCAATSGTLCLAFLAGPADAAAHAAARLSPRGQSSGDLALRTGPLAGGLLRAASGPDDPRNPTVASSSVRVRLLRLARPRTLTLVASQATELRGGARATVLARLRAGDEVSLSVRGGQVVASLGRDTWSADELSLDSEAFALALPGGGANSRRHYSGTLVVADDPSAPGTLRLIHTVDMETYVAAVVQREYGLGDLEGAKAMAVAARTYALRSRGRFGRAYDLVDDVQSQVFFGLQGVDARSREAAQQTRGEVLTYRGQLAEAVYSSSSGGYTAANETIWGTAPVPYLRARPDPYDAASSLSSWTKTADRTRLLSALSARLNVPVTGFLLTGTAVCGRSTVVEALLENGRRSRISTARFRSIVNAEFGSATLRSARFSARMDGSEYVFTGGGFGHGVGMSQWGAHGQALAGRSYRDILGFYYPGTQIRGADGLNTPLVPLPSVIRPEDDEAALLERALAHLGTPSDTPPRSEPTRPAPPRATPPRTEPTRPAPERRPTETPPARRPTETPPPVEPPRRDGPATPPSTPPTATATPSPTTAPGWSGPAAQRTPTRRTGW